jgi:hypothetical protein
MELISGKITDISSGGIVTIKAPYDNIDRLVLRQYDTVEIGLPDGRTITPEQRRKAYALMHEIAEWMGDVPEYVKRLMKMEFIVTRLQGLTKQIFSLSTCDVTTAREFITYLIDFMIEHGVPSKTSLRDMCEDIERYVYACLMHKKCAICGEATQLHHYDTVGAHGGNRSEICHIGMRVLPLCLKHHSMAHTKGRKWLTEDEHLIPIPLTAEIGKVYKMTKKQLGEQNG